MPAIITYTFVDNNGNEARTRVYVSETQTLESVTSAVQTVGEALSALSDAALISAEFRYTKVFSDAIPPQVQSNVYERLFLFFTNGAYTASLSIPSPGTLPFNVDGNYRDIVITREALILSGVQELENVLAEFAVIPDLRAWPTPLVSGVTSKNKL